MSATRLSVVVVSSGRPKALVRCLKSLWQQAHAGCEVILVADRAGLDAANTLPFAPRLKAYLQPQPNISKARNIGIAAAAGDVVAFIDDDAVAEPTWTHHILRTFADPDLVAMTGPVLGRNGISVQWGPTAVNRVAQDIPMDLDQPLPDGFVRKLQGTNMAVRRAVLERLGGFDEAFTFYLDDTDMALRISRGRLKTAYVPDVVVHHGFGPSVRRTKGRVPLSLFDIGASSAVFLQKHGRDMDTVGALHLLEAEQSSRLLRLAKARKLDPGKMRNLMQSLHDGITAGKARSSDIPDIQARTGDFEPFKVENPGLHRLLCGRSYRYHSLRAEAAKLVAQGHNVSLFCFGLIPRKHRVQFVDGGWWEQTGGTSGPSDRNAPGLRFTTFEARKRLEVSRISAVRGL